mmetsp:Transcript_14524/g.28618  ORF Transcript_14524/g.28618 Transcript_14524/m.28618 type:complete len:129 (-) Transcript_14524:74-460(-)|eukprot:CAMPEP_0172714894 /NCGR_PEP_ID=MMETSP1074-20121228/67225_1 /TAXON_ID=2916 /ORGANISM="Ceratium fusus, Strain PA161109" /LENGTH=128 /DNA_ID=CAMNT_0013539415 /DNA_START=62 /DNA_END=448 /DNA_ORIENTATION=+
MQCVQMMAIVLLASTTHTVLGALRVSAAMADAAHHQDATLHTEMHSMMEDDDDDDNVDGSKFLQMGNGADSSSEALQDSAASLSSALGPRWIGSELEADAKQKTNALLTGIAGHNSVGILTRMLGALP